MIWESALWKDDLSWRAADVRRRMDQRRWSEASFVRLEQSLMLGFYSIRKLTEAGKLSDSVASQPVSLYCFAALPGKRVTHLNWHRLDDLYGLSDARKVTRRLDFVCNQFIHSFVLVLAQDEAGRFSGVYVASDRQRHKGLFLIGAPQLVGVFESVGRDCPSMVDMQWDDVLGDYRVRSA